MKGVEMDQIIYLSPQHSSTRAHRGGEYTMPVMHVLPGIFVSCALLIRSIHTTECTGKTSRTAPLHFIEAGSHSSLAVLLPSKSIPQIKGKFHSQGHMLPGSFPPVLSQGSSLSRCGGGGEGGKETKDAHCACDETAHQWRLKQGPSGCTLKRGGREILGFS